MAYLNSIPGRAHFPIFKTVYFKINLVCRTRMYEYITPPPPSYRVCCATVFWLN